MLYCLQASSSLLLLVFLLYSPVASKGPKITVDSATASLSGPGTKGSTTNEAEFGKQLLKDVKLGEKDTLEVNVNAAATHQMHVSPS